MRRNYSRLASVEESKNIRKAVVFGILTIVILVLLVVFGIPTVANLAGYFIGLGSKPIGQIQDTTPPGPPFIKPLPEASNKDTIMVSGNSEAEATIEIFVNDEKVETQADADGKFSEDITLTKGSNVIYAKAKDKAGNESVDSSKFSVFYSKDKPKLEVTTPSEGNNFFGSKQQQISVEGKTCVDCSVTINSRIALVDDEGNFKLTYSLGNGSNSLNIKATDKAGNVEEITITVNFTP